MAHTSCMQEHALTRHEQAVFTDWLIRSLAERPEDFVREFGRLCDRRAGIHLTYGDGQICDPVMVEMFAPKYRRLIRAAMHRHRHRMGSPAWRVVSDRMAKCPLTSPPAITIPPDEFSRTAPQVERLRELVVQTIERRPAVSVMSVLALVCVVAMAAATAFAG